MNYSLKATEVSVLVAIAEKVREWKERQEKIARGEISGETEETTEEAPPVTFTEVGLL